MASVVKCPVCGKLVSVRFPVHECKPKRRVLGAVEWSESRSMSGLSIRNVKIS
jgi:hypothetical protein